MKVLYPLRRHDDVDGPKADVSLDGKWMLAWGHGRNFERYDVATGKLAGNQHSAATISQLIIAKSVRSLDFVLNLSLSWDGKRFLVVQGPSDQERILFFDAATLKPLN